jgi:hypothetical protein
VVGARSGGEIKKIVPFLYRWEKKVNVFLDFAFK